MDIQTLSHTINQINEQVRHKVASAINQGLSLRNWLVGYYIIEYEQSGEDRAQYGSNLLKTLARSLDAKGMTAPELSRYRQFYQVYPEILGTASQEFQSLLSENPIFGTLSQKFLVQAPSAYTPKLLSRLAFSHFVELIKIEDSLKRQFYEQECIRSTWSVRELKRQIKAQYYERSALSTDKEALATQTLQSITPASSTEAVKDYYVFEFLGFPEKHLVSEQDLETALLDNMQQVIMELGEGFCFEARQKRILIGDEYYFIDLVFYHRILKCHVLIELKVDGFDHGHMGQLNTYLNYYNDQIKQTDDRPAIGILMVTEQNKALVQYATAGIEETLFVKDYKLKLPDETAITSAMQAYLNKKVEG